MRALQSGGAVPRGRPPQLSDMVIRNLALGASLAVGNVPVAALLRLATGASDDSDDAATMVADF